MTQRPSKTPPDPKASFDENERQYRVLDQMLSAHSMLRDTFERRSKILKISLFSSSIILTGFALVDDKLFKFVSMTPDAGKFALGLASIVIMVLSVVELLVGWERKAALHENASNRLGVLKLKYRQASIKHQGRNVLLNEALSKEWNRINKTLPKVPDNQFVRFKHRHYIKRQLSELADLNREVPYFMLWFMFYAEGIKKAIWSGLTRPHDAIDKATPPSSLTASSHENGGSVQPPSETKSLED